MLWKLVLTIEPHCTSIRRVISPAQVDFSQRCRANLAAQQVQRLRDWQQDYNLRTACRHDVPNFCASALTVVKKQAGF